jgi:hypothetical protein
MALTTCSQKNEYKRNFRNKNVKFAHTLYSWMKAEKLSVSPVFASVVLKSLCGLSVSLPCILWKSAFQKQIVPKVKWMHLTAVKIWDLMKGCMSLVEVRTHYGKMKQASSAQYWALLLPEHSDFPQWCLFGNTNK